MCQSVELQKSNSDFDFVPFQGTVRYFGKNLRNCRDLSAE